MALKLAVLDETPERLTVAVRGASIGLANALRRTLIADLPAFAVDEVDVYENTSVAFNEYLANRLALVPLTWEDGVSPDAKIALSLDAEGPATVLSGDLKSADEKIKVHNEKIPIIKLGERQRLRVEAVAVQGRARDHAKFQNALGSYAVLVEDAKKNGACPTHALGEKEKIETKNCPTCRACADLAKTPLGAAKPGDVLFTVESYNNVTAREQLARAVERLQETGSALADAMAGA